MEFSNVFYDGVLSKLCEFMGNNLLTASVSKQFYNNFDKIETYSFDVTDSVENLEFAISNGYELSEETYRQALKKNDVRILIFLHHNNCPWYSGIEEDVVKYGYLDLLKWVINIDIDNAKYFHIKSLCEKTATKYGHLHIIQWTKEIFEIKLDFEIVSKYAKINNQLEVFNWSFNESIKDHLEELKYDMGFGCCKKDIRMCYFEAENGHLECLKYLREENDFPWDSSVINIARQNGHIDCANWCIDNGCPES
jgi:hypothetical protein